MTQLLASEGFADIIQTRRAHRLDERRKGLFQRLQARDLRRLSQCHQRRTLHRYLAEFDFRYSNRSKLGIEDAERAALALKGIEGKRLTYHQPAH
jgi:hypothetical protein